MADESKQTIGILEVSQIRRRLQRWVYARLGDIEHERQVASIAAMMVRTTAPLHGMTRRQQLTLHLGALVHDVGRCKGEKSHAPRGAAMILGKKSLPLRPNMRRTLAYLTRYHRGAVPPAGRDEILSRDDDHEGLRTTLAFLRAADSLDCRSLESPRLMMHLRGRQLRITVLLNEDSNKARRVLGRRKKLRMLEEMLGCTIDVQIAVGRGRELAGSML
jgi:exopolyphosphatase/pppGpp-phosphohydrolase